MRPPNLDAPAIDVQHSTLELIDPGGSPFRVKCPTCGEGMLLVQRDPTTFELIRNDHCILCGQHVRYSDKRIAGLLLYPIVRGFEFL